jgi:SAM-dependent methyltransferase
MKARDAHSGTQMEIAGETAVALKSPLSTRPPIKVRDLPKSFILEELESYYQAKPPELAVESDYSMWRCSETGLEFAWPMQPGNASFYEWVSSFSSYYPEMRWEYGEVLRVLKALKVADANFLQVLDVGCGEGKFLGGLDFIPAERRFGLDFNEPGVEACRQRGFQAYLGTIDAGLTADFIKLAQFPIVTSFHCLEHVDQPVEFVRSLVSVTAPGGRVFISTPYSPMSFETEWFDVLNHPPHHLTRWNIKAYQQLAGILGLKMRYFFPPSSAIRQALMTFRLAQYGPYRQVGSVRVCGDMLRHLPQAWRAYRSQRQRARGNGGVMADVILVELTVP